MKKIFLQLVFLFSIITSAFAQENLFLENPQPLSTTTDTCIFGADTLICTVTETDPLCNGGSSGTATVNVIKGTPSYTYLWSNGQTTATATGYPVGTKNIEVWDGAGNDCVFSFTITEPGPLTVVISPPTPITSCFNSCDGSASSAGSTGGTFPYTYLWDNGQTTSTATGLCSGTHTLTITDSHGCTTHKSFFTNQPNLLVANGSSTTIDCFGSCDGTASVNPSGGNPPYTYLWSPGGATTSSITGLCAGNYTCTFADSKNCPTSPYVAFITQPAAPLSATVTSTNVTCISLCNGTATANAGGGTPSYTYLWSSGGETTSAITGLCVGNYTLTLHDANGCALTKTVSVTLQNVFTASITSATPNPLNCNGDCNGTAAATLTGGMPTYTYLWSTGATTPSVTGLCAGTYTLQANDANGCPASASVTFLQPTTLTVTISKSNPTCNNSCNGSISVVAGGGTPGYTFLWLPGNQTTSSIASQCPGNYTIMVTDSKGCASTQTVTLGAPNPLSANASVVNNILCAGQCNGSAAANPIGGNAPFTYLWSNGQTTSAITGLCSGNYTVTVTDANGCFDVSTVNISQPIVLSSSVSSSTSSCTLCTGTANISTSGGTSPYTFLWTPSGQTVSSASGLCIGSYTVNINDNNGCANTVTVTINPVVTITVNVSGTTVSCPGSCDGIANATPFGGGSPYTYQWSTAPVQTSQSATGLCAGNYTIDVADVNGCISTNTVTFTNPPPLTITMNSTNASCGICNGTATASSSGGTGAYTYTWSGFPIQTTATATGLCSGNYSVTVADANNCTLTNTVTVGNIPTISDNPTTTLATCGASDGDICVSPSGGTAPYTYLWSPSGKTTGCISGLAAGIYTVTISDAASCEVIFPIALGNAAGPTINIVSSADPSCNGYCNGSISISASGATPPYTYLWSPGGQSTTAISNLCSGNYIIQVWDAFLCSSFASITLTDPAALIPNPTITNVSCNGGNDGNICLSPSGGNTPYTFSWSNGQTTSCATGLTGGTYTVALSDVTGCSDTILIPIAEPAILSVSITSTNVTCNGNCDGTATANISGGTALYTYTWSTGSHLPTIVGLCNGTYSVSVTDSKGCVATASVVITQPVILTSTISPTNELCNGDCNGSATLTASGGTTPYTYSWLPNGETTSAITGLCIGNYIGTITDAHGCSSTQTILITEPPSLSATVTPVNASCSGSCDGTASANIIGGTGTYTYLWNPGGFTTSSVSGLCTGLYSLDVTDANGCVTNQNFSISSPPALQPNITSASPTCFAGCNGTASSSPVGGTGTYTFSWNTIPVQTTATVTGLCAGSYTLTLSDANGCFINQPITINSPPVLMQANGVAGATCLLCDGSISVIASGGTVPYSYIWNTGATTANITGLCAGIYIDTVKDANGCISVDTTGVSNTSGPVITVNGTNISCFGTCDGSAIVSSAVGNGPPWIYSWFPSNQTTQSITGLCPNQYFATITDINGCKTIDPINITEPAQLSPNPVITNATCFGLCDGSVTSIPSGGTPPFTFNWLPGNQTTSSIASQCAGNYTLTVTDSHSCIATTTISIGENTILASTITSTNDSCNGLCDGTATINILGGTAPYSYAWTGGQTTINATGLCAGTFTIVTTDNIGCIKIDSAIISQPAVLAPNITAINPLCNGVCNGTVSANPTGGTFPYSYLWNPSAQTTSSVTGLCAGVYTLTLSDTNKCSVTNTVTLTNPPAISSTHTVTIASCTNTCDGSANITPSGGTGIYTFSWFPAGQATQNVSGLCPGIDSVQITDANGCVFTDIMTVGVSTLVIAAAGNDTAFCPGGTAILCSSSNTTNIMWYQLPSWTQIDTTTCINATPFITTTYAIVAINGMCNDTDSVAVTVFPGPFISIGSNQTITSGGVASLNVTTNGINYFWSPATGLSCVSCLNPSANPTTSTTYTFFAVDTATGCTAYDTVRVIVVPAVVPNDGISPNGDGKNDVWIIPNIEQFPQCVVEVYNRWGELLFSSTGYSIPWDGKYKGKDLPVGTYYYTINLNSNLYPEPITGPITIMR